MPLQRKLLLVIAPLVLLPIGVLGLYALQSELESSRIAWKRSAEGWVEQLREVVEAPVSSGVDALHRIQREEELLAALVADPEDAALREAFAKTAQLLPSSRVVRVELVTGDGVRAAVLDLADGLKASEFDSGLVPGDHQVHPGRMLGAARSDSTGGAFVWIAEPIHTESQQPERSGSLVLTLPLEMPRLQGLPGLKQPLLLLLDPAREVVGTSHEGYLPWRVSPQEVAGLRAARTQEDLGAMKVGDAMMRGIAHEFSNGLTAVVLVPDGSIRDSALIPGAKILAVTVCSMVLMFAVVSLVCRRLLTRPLAQLGDSLNGFTQGDLNRPVALGDRDDEIGALAGALEKMRRGLRVTQDETRRLVNEDALTGLPNRRSILERIEAEVERCRRNQDGRFAVMFIDLDNFKAINDSMGHKAGDRMIMKVAQRLVEGMRAYDSVGIQRAPQEMDEDQTDYVARLGGDEFLVLVNDVDDSAVAARIAERTYKLFEEPLLIDELQLRVSMSIGIVMYPDNGLTADQLVKNADVAMYSAKTAGKNQFRFFDSSMESAARRSLEIESELRRALSDGSLQMHYQPQVDMNSNEVCGAEALLRWFHADRGWIPPSEFVPVAESCGLIRELGNWVLVEVMRQAKAWMDEGIGIPKVAINLSSFQIASSGLAERVAELIERMQLDPRRLEFELTETAILGNKEIVNRNLTGLRELGCRIALDDFGTGYSSLAWAKFCPVDVIKIDRSFVNNVTHEPADRAIIASVVELAHQLKVSVLAEGIETEDEAAALRALGCELVQGYLFARPMEADAVARWLHEREPKRAKTVAVGSSGIRLEVAS